MAKKEKALNGLECCRSAPCKCFKCPYQPKDLNDVRRNYKATGNSYACTRAELIRDLGELISDLK